MTVQRCHLCELDADEARLYGGDGLDEGSDCPVCYQPTCRYHLTTVRWRWRESGRVDAALVCKACKRTYSHRDWDALNRDWIS